ncbi:MAG: recombinase family protein [Myxococcales bacterium]|nr:recombinase family protein [Myxococcales bacterium]
MKSARKGNGKIAIGYLRVSTEDQKLGPEAQRAAIEAWAAREGVAIVEWFTDSGVSGGSEIADRPGLLAALTALRVRSAGLLLIAKRDRIARDVVIAGMIDRAVTSAGARTVAADGAGNGESPADAFMRTILDGAAEYERALIRARTSAALKAKRARGERAGEVPFDYHLAADGARLDLDPGEQNIIANVCALRAAGLSLRGIVADLAAAGCVGRTGKALALTQVARIAGAAA